ncbi:hypothetical protein CCUS01_02094 [Colletotrichum cuscutae]|uniref:Uncharacterized protein n=1 Tax=Colletotrichum cuscutae TaxID=1209917 RepID=A0AAI9U2U2_9PEZI|nr:hypothetical protein CCUS01_02094 [Colletotrichum cuscutae]
MSTSGSRSRAALAKLYPSLSTLQGRWDSIGAMAIMAFTLTCEEPTNASSDYQHLGKDFSFEPELVRPNPSAGFDLTGAATRVGDYERASRTFLGGFARVAISEYEVVDFLSFFEGYPGAAPDNGKARTKYIYWIPGGVFLRGLVASLSAFHSTPDGMWLGLLFRDRQTEFAGNIHQAYRGAFTRATRNLIQRSIPGSNDSYPLQRIPIGTALWTLGKGLSERYNAYVSLEDLGSIVPVLHTFASDTLLNLIRAGGRWKHSQYVLPDKTNLVNPPAVSSLKLYEELVSLLPNDGSWSVDPIRPGGWNSTTSSQDSLYFVYSLNYLIQPDNRVKKCPPRTIDPPSSHYRPWYYSFTLGLLYDLPEPLGKFYSHGIALDESPPNALAMGRLDFTPRMAGTKIPTALFITGLPLYSVGRSLGFVWHAGCSAECNRNTGLAGGVGQGNTSGHLPFAIHFWTLAYYSVPVYATPFQSLESKSQTVASDWQGQGGERGAFHASHALTSLLWSRFYSFPVRILTEQSASRILLTRIAPLEELPRLCVLVSAFSNYRSAGINHRLRATVTTARRNPTLVADQSHECIAVHQYWQTRDNPFCSRAADGILITISSNVGLLIMQKFLSGGHIINDTFVVVKPNLSLTVSIPITGILPRPYAEVELDFQSDTYSPNRHPTPPPATIAASVLTHGLSYGNDCTSLKAFIPRLGSQKTRAVGVIDPETTDEESLAMHRAGVRGLRVNLYQFKAMEDVELQKVALRSHLNRILDYRPIAPMELDDDDDPHRVLDHAGAIRPRRHSLARRHLGYRSLCVAEGDKSAARQDLTPAPYRISDDSPGYSDVEFLHRVLWGSDWPHTPRMKGDASLRSWLSDEEWDLLMVQNPSHIFGRRSNMSFYTAKYYPPYNTPFFSSTNIFSSTSALSWHRATTFSTRETGNVAGIDPKPV